MSWIQEKHMILLTRKAHWIGKVLWNYELTNKTETGKNKNQEVLQA
jgi:hypothetical protein